MFAINGLEAVLFALWLIGIICSLAYLPKARRLAGVALVAVALVVPVIGSLVAIAVFVKRTRHGLLHHEPH